MEKLSESELEAIAKIEAWTSVWEAEHAALMAEQSALMARYKDNITTGKYWFASSICRKMYLKRMREKLRSACKELGWRIKTAWRVLRYGETEDPEDGW